MSQALRAGLARLDTTTRITLAVLALASGVYTYLGVRDLLEGEGLPVFFAAIVYSSAVSVGIYAFWSYLLFFLPHVRSWKDRRTLSVALVLGSAMIVAMSSWLNAAALAGGAALEQHLATTAEEYQHRLDAAYSNALAAQGLLPDIELAASRFQRLADEEEAGGALTGTSGSGTVVQLLRQMAADLQNLANEVRASREIVDQLYAEGGENLAAMRAIVSASGPVEERSNEFGKEAVALAGVIASLQQTSIAPAVKRAADDLSATFVAPAAGGRSADLAARQSEVVERVQGAVEAQASALSSAADTILAREPVQPLRFTALSTPEAVLRYARDFLPSWAGAISIDLLPAVMILILAGVQAAIRREEGEELEEHGMTAGELMRAMRIYHRLREEDRDIDAGRPVEEAPGAPATPGDDPDPAVHITRLEPGSRRSGPPAE
ncbi:hypothetical protein [Amorphus sp. 3PC139-8]|uniref:hypothetical protein n=1 Tax=Amorphus sp. 3PC139-8 TaxID=2735676 RepID=UPI00345DC75E